MRARVRRVRLRAARTTLATCAWAAGAGRREGRVGGVGVAVGAASGWWVVGAEWWRWRGEGDNGHTIERDGAPGVGGWADGWGWVGGGVWVWGEWVGVVVVVGVGGV